jgi:shikimate dehydrogenase
MSAVSGIESQQRPIVLAGLIGADIQLSKSPSLHEGEARHHGVDYRYELIDLSERGLSSDQLPELLAEVERRGFAGVNITHPLKQAVIPHLTHLAQEARQLGAVNTVVFRNGQRIGHNTDWYGFYRNFETGLPDVSRRHALLLGAGGAGVAVGHAALKLGIERLFIADREPERAAKLSTELNTRFGSERAFATTEIAAAMKDADGLIHATPTGMKRHPGLPLHADLIDARHWVADIVYTPLETPLLALAKARGCRTLDGGGMVVFQAAGALKLFAGIEPDAERMNVHLRTMITQEGLVPLVRASGSN